MKLSEAIILGDSLKRPDYKCWLSLDGSCGCAFGGAILALGLADGYIADREAMFDEGFGFEPMESHTIMNAFPWLTEVILNEISTLYRRVCDGQITIEDVAAYVRSVEPTEQIATVIELEYEPKAEVCQ